jgi:hypothetical protein
VDRGVGVVGDVVPALAEAPRVGGTVETMVGAVAPGVVVVLGLASRAAGPEVQAPIVSVTDRATSPMGLNLTSGPTPSPPVVDGGDTDANGKELAGKGHDDVIETSSIIPGRRLRTSAQPPARKRWTCPSPGGETAGCGSSSDDVLRPTVGHDFREICGARIEVRTDPGGQRVRYIASMSSAYFSQITLLRILRVGVSSPVSIVHGAWRSV